MDFGSGSMVSLNVWGNGQGFVGAIGSGGEYTWYLPVLAQAGTTTYVGTCNIGEAPTVVAGSGSNVWRRFIIYNQEGWPGSHYGGTYVYGDNSVPAVPAEWNTRAPNGTSFTCYLDVLWYDGSNNLIGSSGLAFTVRIPATVGNFLSVSACDLGQIPNSSSTDGNWTSRQFKIKYGTNETGWSASVPTVPVSWLSGITSSISITATLSTRWVRGTLQVGSASSRTFTVTLPNFTSITSGTYTIGTAISNVSVRTVTALTTEYSYSFGEHTTAWGALGVIASELAQYIKYTDGSNGVTRDSSGNDLASCKINVRFRSGSTTLREQYKTFNVRVPKSWRISAVSIALAFANQFQNTNIQGKSSVTVTNEATLSSQVSVTYRTDVIEPNNHLSQFAGESFAFDLAQAGEYTVQTTATDMRGYSVSDTATIKVVPYQAPVLQFKNATRLFESDDPESLRFYFKLIGTESITLGTNSIYANTVYTKFVIKQGNPNGTDFEYVATGFGDFTTVPVIPPNQNLETNKMYQFDIYIKDSISNTYVLSQSGVTLNEFVLLDFDRGYGDNNGQVQGGIGIGDIHRRGLLDIYGDTYFGTTTKLVSLLLYGTLDVKGQGLFNSLDVNNGVGIGGTLGVEGNAQFGGGLGVTGNTQLGGDASVSGNLTISGNMNLGSIKQMTMNIGYGTLAYFNRIASLVIVYVPRQIVDYSTICENKKITEVIPQGYHPFHSANMNLQRNSGPIDKSSVKYEILNDGTMYITNEHSGGNVIQGTGVWITNDSFPS
jgi:hypothetical protein